MFISMQILIFHPLCNVNLLFTEAHCVSLGFLWLDVKLVNKKTHFSFNVIFFMPENEILNSVKVFLAFNGSAGSAGFAGSGGSTVC